MDIVIVADFCGRFDENWKSSRFLDLAERLSEEHSVELITSDFNHGLKSFFPKMPEGFPFKITMLHESGYPKNICVKRFFSHFVWGSNVRRYLKKRKKPDVIMAAMPTLYAAYVSGRYCGRNGVRFLVDVQDLWPEAFRMAMNIPVISDMLFLPFRILANGAYRMADQICTVSQTYTNRVLQVNRKIKTGTTVFLGTELSDFDQNAGENREKILEETKIVQKSKDELWLAYCGGMSDSYDLDCVIDALQILKQRGLQAPRFIAMGDGYKRELFMQHAERAQIDACFTGNLPYEKMCALLSWCDMTVNPITGHSAASIINKHADYAASGLPVLNTQESPEYQELVETYEMGLNCKNGDPNNLADRIQLLLQEPELRIRMGHQSRKCAEERFDRKYTYPILARRILGE